MVGKPPAIPILLACVGVSILGFAVPTGVYFDIGSSSFAPSERAVLAVAPAAATSTEAASLGDVAMPELAPPTAPVAKDYTAVVAEPQGLVDESFGIDRFSDSSSRTDGAQALVRGVAEAITGVSAAPPELIIPAATGVAGIAILLLLPESLRAGLFGGITPFYHRIRRDEILDSRGRQRVYDSITAEPGLSVRETVDRTGYSWGTIVYHLQRLEGARLVVSKRVGRNRRLFATGHTSEDQAAIAVLRNERTATVAAFVAAHPGTTQQEVCAALGISAPVAHKFLRRLGDANLLTYEREWRFVHYYPDARLGELLAGMNGHPRAGLVAVVRPVEVAAVPA